MKREKFYIVCFFQVFFSRESLSEIIYGRFHPCLTKYKCDFYINPSIKINIETKINITSSITFKRLIDIRFWQLKNTKKTGKKNYKKHSSIRNLLFNWKRKLEDVGNFFIDKKTLFTFLSTFEYIECFSRFLIEQVFEKKCFGIDWVLSVREKDCYQIFKK